MKAKINKQYRVIKISLLFLLSIFLISSILMSFIFFKVSDALLHRRNEKQIQISLNPNEFWWKEVMFKSKKDNLTLKGTLFYAKEQSNKTLIVVHGFDENRLMAGRTEMLVEHLIPRGYNILAFDLRGQGQSEGNIISFGYNEKYDVLGAIDYLKENGKIAEKIALLGFSMGAVTVIEAAGKDTRIDAIIADSPFSDLKIYIMNDSNTLPNNLDIISNDLGDLSYWSMLRYVPFKNKIITLIAKIYGLNINDVSPKDTVKNISPKPIFLIHGKNDRVIPYTNSEAIFKSLKDDSNTVFWLTENAGHIESLKMYSKEYVRKIEVFLNKNM